MSNNGADTILFHHVEILNNFLYHLSYQQLTSILDSDYNSVYANNAHVSFLDDA